MVMAVAMTKRRKSWWLPVSLMSHHPRRRLLLMISSPSSTRFPVVMTDDFDGLGSTSSFITHGPCFHGLAGGGTRIVVCRPGIRLRTLPSGSAPRSHLIRLSRRPISA